MRFIQNLAIRAIGGVLVAASLALLLSSCGPGATGFVVRGTYYDAYSGRYHYNGDRRGDYVFYRGHWYLYGIGTPYERDPYYDPYIYY